MTWHSLDFQNMTLIWTVNKNSVLYLTEDVLILRHKANGLTLYKEIAERSQYPRGL